MGERAPLVSIPEAPVPDHGTAEWFSGADGATLRAALFSPPGTPRGSVVVSPGRSEPIEKYFEVVDDLLNRGFVVLVHDWRGQGLSARALPDRLKGHAKGFRPFLSDFSNLLETFGDRLPKPWIALGHSMGGCLTTLALAHGESRFSACVLSAPMLGLNTGGKPARAARALAWIFARAGLAGDYTLGERGDPFVQSFARDALTHDEARYDRYQAQLTANPDIALGGTTWGWVDFAFSACAWLRRSPGVEAIAIPVTIVGAGEDSRVLNSDLKAIATRIPNGRYLEVPGAFHEILIEIDARRAQFWSAFDETVDPVAPLA
ncbi:MULTISPECIES: alpha/beta fold hydrolase [unclassified Caulobacter]|uniref:alpha/beta fold hydrolase n=1 Tax=unclassified Caulobacter TaxID=2648921 RepID=UPI000D393D94|nr:MULTISPECIES: alpha/beta hydrolase [unclassified Caulobacter]PTS87190.1 alpha/beta hydrolase [Caulobacter sp. HMWF009]PTT05150.1 alpha/beta hydrolase [Caulobacter sp. HMWF025]